VMQLPPTDELILVSGVPPIRAKKARYFEDIRLTERVLAPADVNAKGAMATPDDWSRLPVPAANDGREAISRGEPHGGDAANGGIRREPELPEHEEITPKPANTVPEFVFSEDDPDDDAIRTRVLREQARGVARQAAMDPGDGLELSE
jgi:type IV secretion system protein VirD4